MPTLFRIEGLTAGYPGRREVLAGLDLTLPAGGITAIVGPNGCGKSTLLLTLARLLRPESGRILLQDNEITTMRPRELARRVAFLPQHPVAPEGVRVRDLVMRGRQPHRSFLMPPTERDHAVVTDALMITGTAELADHEVGRLSGGQRQRIWIAMALAQDTDVMLLDEPTSFLDIAHQVEVLGACATLTDPQNGRDRSVVAVLHDLGLAARYAQHMVLMDGGAVAAAGTPEQVLTTERVAEVFGFAARVVPDPETGTPLVVPRRPVNARAAEPVGRQIDQHIDQRTVHQSDPETGQQLAALGAAPPSEMP